jgi:hypothetical protein
LGSVEGVEEPHIVDLLQVTDGIGGVVPIQGVEVGEQALGDDEEAVPCVTQAVRLALHVHMPRLVVVNTATHHHIPTSSSSSSTIIVIIIIVIIIILFIYFLFFIL